MQTATLNLDPHFTVDIAIKSIITVADECAYNGWLHVLSQRSHLMTFCIVS